MVFWCKSHKSWQYVITLSLFRSRTLCVTRPWAAWRRGWCVARAWTPPPSPPTSSSSCRSTKTSTDCQIQTGLPGISPVKSIGGKVITKNISVNMVLTLQSLVPSSNKTPRPALPGQDPQLALTGSSNKDDSCTSRRVHPHEIPTDIYLHEASSGQTATSLCAP